MPIRLRTYLILGALLCLAAGLAWSLPGNAVGQSLFQSSPPLVSPPLVSSATPTATYPVPTGLPTVTPPPTVDLGPIEIGTPTEQPVFTAAPEVATPAAALFATDTPIPAATPAGVAGYLPPPTLTAPGAFPSGAGLPRLVEPRQTSLAQPLALADGAQSASRDGAGSASNTPSRRLLRTLLAVLGYLWLCCGALFLAAAAVAVAWLARRRPPD